MFLSHFYTGINNSIKIQFTFIKKNKNKYIFYAFNDQINESLDEIIVTRVDTKRYTNIQYKLYYETQGKSLFYSFFGGYFQGKKKEKRTRR